VAAGIIGGFVGGSLRAPDVVRRSEPRWLTPAAAAVLVALCVFALQVNAGERTTAEITLREVAPAPEREVVATVELDPPDAAEDAEWFNATAWQGGGSVVEPLEEVRPGVYETDGPIPVHSNWKSTLRLHKDRQVAGLPIFMPADEAVPVKEIPAQPRFTREFVLDKENLQREQKKGVSTVLVTGAYLFVLLVAIGLIGSLGWGLARFSRLSRSRDSAAADVR
jgi:hypothetical protein